ncbi:hypothetical protein B7463_g3185, partial [Scytalidium lignicola]
MRNLLHGARNYSYEPGAVTPPPPPPHQIVTRSRASTPEESTTSVDGSDQSEPQSRVKLQAFQAYQPPKTNASVITIATELDTLQAEIEDIDPSEQLLNNAKLEISMESISNYEFIVAKFMDMERRIRTAKESIKEEAFSASDKSQKFKGKCFHYSKIGHKMEDCRKLKKEGGSPSTGPLLTSSGKQSWMATTTGTASSVELLWIVDPGASRHMTYSKEAFREYSELPEPIAVQTAGGAEIWTISQGTMTLKIALKGQLQPIALTEVLHVLDLARSLISVLRLQDKEILFQTTKNKWYQGKLLISRNGKAIGEAQRLGHLSVQELQNLYTVTSGLDHPITTLQESYKLCTLAKTVMVVNRQRIFTEFKAKVELETSLKIKAWENGVSERLNKTLTALAKAILINAYLPAKFWEDAIATTSYLRNCTLIGLKGRPKATIQLARICSRRRNSCFDLMEPPEAPEATEPMGDGDDDDDDDDDDIYLHLAGQLYRYCLRSVIGDDVPEDTIALEASEPTFDSGEPEELSEPNSERNSELESDAESELIGNTILVDTRNKEYAN